MRGFKFIKKNNKYIWTNDIIKLEFSDASFQAFDEYGYVKNLHDIMHHYYTVSIYKYEYITTREKIGKDNKIIEESIYKWKLITQRSTYDFPCISQLQLILEQFINDKIDVKRTGEIIKYKSGAIDYSKRLSTEGFACDDFYEVTKYVDKYNKLLYYTLYIGCTYDLQGDCNSAGIRLNQVYKEDIDELYKCVNVFIEDTIAKHNENILQNFKSKKQKFISKDNKLYEMQTRNSIESIYCVNDNVDITYLNYISDTEFNSIDLDNIIIQDITDNCITCVDNTKKEYVINIKNLLLVSCNINDDKLAYNVEEITNDFYNILNDQEKDEFKRLTQNQIFKKYSSAIIDRTWMCREEHEFINFIPHYIYKLLSDKDSTIVFDTRNIDWDHKFIQLKQEDLEQYKTLALKYNDIDIIFVFDKSVEEDIFEKINKFDMDEILKYIFEILTQKDKSFLNNSDKMYQIHISDQHIKNAKIFVKIVIASIIKQLT